MKRRTQSNGVYFDRSTKGEVGKQHHSYRAEDAAYRLCRRATGAVFALPKEEAR